MKAARPVLVIWLLLGAITISLAIRATFAAPRGTAFVGTFYYVDDFYNYLSYVEQAQRGALAFRSKLASPEHAPALLNLEWLVVGWAARALGGRALLAYRIFGLLCLLVLVALTARWLVRCGLPRERRLPGLLLVFTGGGLGGVLVALGRWPSRRAFDLVGGIYPFVEALGNPHFVAGTTLLLGTLTAFARRRIRLAIALGIALALVRPYDAALLLAIEGVASLLEVPPRGWPRRLAPLAAVLPPLAYDAFVVRTRPGFQVFASPVYGAITVSAVELLVAVGPAALLTLTLLPTWNQGGDDERAHRRRLGLWVAAAALIVMLRPVPFALQFAAGLGLPLLVLGAVGLARAGRRWLEAAALLMPSTALVAIWLCAAPNLDSHPPIERLRVADAMRRLCRPGELALAPPDIGLYLGGMTPCWPFVSHAAAPEHAARVAAVRRFYDPASPAAERLAWLERACVAHLVLSPQLGGEWLAGSGYRPALLVDGPNGALAVWSRERPLPCQVAVRP